MAREVFNHKPVRLGRQGRLVIPAHVRRALLLHEGDRLALEIEGERLVLVPQRGEVRRLQGMFKRPPGSSSVVEELIAERREEALRETDA